MIFKIVVVTILFFGISFYATTSILHALKDNRQVSQVNQDLIKEFLRRQTINRDLIKENNEILVSKCFK